jgi:glycosyltransferase involved in cell wall biosynthesis
MPRFLRYTFAVPEVRGMLRAFAPEVVNAHFLPNYGWLGALAGARPLVLTALGSDFLLVPQRSALHRWRTHEVLRRCDAVTSDAVVLTEAIRAFGVPAERILTVPLGIEAERFATIAERPAAPVVVLSTRRLEPVYDVGTLLDAWEMLGRAERDVLVLRIAGDGSEEAKLRERGLGLAVRFLGWLDMPRLDVQLRAAHIYVSTSQSDSTSVSLLEAMAAGCFPVVSDIPANREWVTDGETALFFRPGDAEGLARCLRRAASDAVLREHAAARNRQVIAERATWESNLRTVEELFERLAKRPGRAS